MKDDLPPSDAVTGVVLAGGRGTRVGGADKGLIELDGQPLVAHVLDNLRPFCGPLLISANRNVERYRLLADRVVEDARGGFLGPLAGLEAAMMAARTPWLLLAPCDMPRIPAELHGELLRSLCREPAYRLTVADDGHRVQPLVCAVRRDALPDLVRYLDDGGRAAHGWLDVTPHGRVRCEVAGGLANHNCRPRCNG